MTLKAMTVLRTAMTLNFILLGDERSGASVVQSTVNQVTDAVCHLDLFHPAEDVRRASHERYFGPTLEPKRSPAWFTSETNPRRYLSNKVFDNPQDGERVIGVRVPYSVLNQ